MVIVDTHLHVVSPDRTAYPLAPVELPNGAWYLEVPVSADELEELQRVAGVVGGVLVQPVAAYGVDNRYALAAAAARPERFHAVVVVDAWSDAGLDQLEGAIDAGASGLRLFDIPPRSEPLLTSPSGRAVADLAVERGVQLVATVLPPGLASVADLADRVDVAVTVEHCGFVELDTPEGRAALVPLTRRPNIRLKVTSHVLGPVAHPARTVRWLADRFGAERLMWGSDFSQTHDRPYGDLVRSAVDATALLDPSERVDFLGATARRLWPLRADTL